MTLQFGASPTDDTRSVNYDRNMFIIQATGFILSANIGLTKVFTNKFRVSFGPGACVIKLITAVIYLDSMENLNSVL